LAWRLLLTSEDGILSLSLSAQIGIPGWSPAVALRETSVVFAAMIGSVFLGEGFAIRRVAASIAVALGVVLLSMVAQFA
jgi:uncharacterized membrane protein